MKLFAIFDAMPEHDRNVTGEYHFLNLASGHVLFVCSPRDHEAAEKHLSALGGKLFPDVMDHSASLPKEIHAHPAFAGVGLDEMHTTHVAAKKLMRHFGWPTLDPRS